MFVVAVAPNLRAASNELANAKDGDWAKFLITTNVDGKPFFSKKDVPRWWVARPNGKYINMRIYMSIGGKPTSAGGSGYATEGDINPMVFATDARIEEVSRTSEDVVAAGKTLKCTKVVRKISQSAGLGRPWWEGTETVWTSFDTPLGLVKLEADYTRQISEDSDKQKVHEVWILSETGSDWQE